MKDRDYRFAATDGDSRPIRSVGLADEAYALILGQLISLKLPPGARITVDELARQFGISQTPIREALGRLETHGLVTKTHLIGYRATPQLTREQFQDLYEIRLLLEPAAARQAALKIEAQEIEALKRFAAEMAEEVARGAQGNHGRFPLHDGEFHARIALAGRNNLIADALSRLHAHVHIFRLYYHSWITESAVREHQAIVEAIARHDADGAERSMRSHIEESWRRLKQGF
ncbi:DNA-binding GntR family transcriptional regulator [Rhodoligotrophos appendicifer]|uniref:GntR family transcriptional regulator n=1 Tax=Rhodoligotrophos appendicifer TaxID=987056 RepID=UPI001180A64A|nr:GntR family transcriptional regulator [Rhodoligotrophos appendicifer]